MAEVPWSTVLGSATLGATASVIAFALLPFAPLQSEPGDQDRSQQERDHCSRDGRTFAEIAAADSALVAKRGHEMRGVSGAAARQHPDELEVGEGEQHRECHHYGDDGRKQGISDVAENLPSARAGKPGRFVKRRGAPLQNAKEGESDEK